MKNKSAILGALLVLVMLVIWAFHKKRQAPIELYPSVTNAVSSIKQIEQSESSTYPPNNSAAAQLPSSNNVADQINQRMKQMESQSQKVLDEWKTPIEFYGRVVDESNSIVSGAQVDFSCNDLSTSGTSSYHAQSDENGMFSIKGISGKLLVVNVSKANYYSYMPYGNSFYYAGQNQNFVPDAGNPVVFQLHTKGLGENLIHIHKSFHVPKDGTPILIDLATGSTVAASQDAIKIQCWTHDNKKISGWKFDWKCLVSVPGGGLQTNTDAFPFLAPADGYSNLHHVVLHQFLSLRDDGWSGVEM